MGYDLHIHRKENWFDENSSKPITYEEWQTVAKADKDLEVIGTAGDILSYGSTNSNTDTVGFHWTQNEIQVTFRGNAAIIKAYELAQILGAKLQGDEGEVYRTDGSSYFEDPDDQAYYDNLRKKTESSEHRSFFSKLFKK
ncbi:MAG: hypothetical protein ABJG88_10985 [Litorimonas sp.]